MKKVLSAFLFIIICISVYSEIPIGKWRTHYSYKTATRVVKTDNLLYAVADEKLFSYDPETHETEIYSYLTGLNSYSVSFINKDDKYKKLIIAYKDGNIDIMDKDGNISNIPDFKNKSIASDKTVYNLRTYGNYSYLCTGAGIIVVNLQKDEIADTYRFSYDYSSVKDVALKGDTIVLVTDNGLYFSFKNKNLSDPDSWYKISFNAQETPEKVLIFNNNIFVVTEEGSLYYDSFDNIERISPDSWKSIIYKVNVKDIKYDSGYLVVIGGYYFYIYDKNFNSKGVNTGIYPYDFSFDSEKKTAYVAALDSGIVVFKNTDSSFVKDTSNIRAKGPEEKIAWDSFFKDGVFYSTTGARWGDRNFLDGQILIFSDDKWSSLIHDKQQIEKKTTYPLLDFMNIAFDPDDDSHYFITSYGEGLYEFRKDTFYIRYGYGNSPLIPMIKDNPRYVRTDGAIFDDNGNLWVMSEYDDHAPESDSAVHILKPDGTWLTPYFSKLPKASTWNKILFARNGLTWINSVRGYNPGIYVLDYNGTIEDKRDDRTKWISSLTDQDGKVYRPYNFNCITEDLDGSMWIGTNDGPFIATNTSNIFNSNFRFKRVKRPRNDGTDNADYLLEKIRINCIKVDGANRKWIGTKGNGLYLLSEDGLKTIHHFDISNSPLPSDNIWSVAINPETGEVFIGTDAGIVSYRDNATEGKDSYGKIYVFPNPVRPGYTGIITVTGLMVNSQVTITDVNGNTMIKGKSLGGQFSWDGYDKRGKRVSSGVYIVFSASEDGTSSATCRFMIIN